VSPLGRVGFALLIALLAVLTWVAWTTFGDPPPAPRSSEIEGAPEAPAGKPDRVRRTPRKSGTGASETTTRSTNADPAKPKRTLIVEVVDDRDAPAAGVEVEILILVDGLGTEEPPFATAATAANGQVRFDVGRFGGSGWSLDAEGAAGTASKASMRSFEDGDTRVRLTLVRDHPLTGRVLVRGGPPLAGAVIDVWYGGRQASSTTDAEGRFVVRGVPPEAFQNEVQIRVLNARGGERATIELDRGPAPPNVQILVDPVCTITGTCVDTSDRPVPLATVTVGMGPGHFRATTRTDEDGKFILDAPQGTWALMAAAKGKELFVRKGVDCSVPTLDAGVLVLEKERTCIVRGRILHRDGTPVVGADVTTGAGRGHTTHFAAVKTDENGRFELETSRRSWVVMVNGYVWSQMIDFDVPTLDVGTLEGSRERR
jgi:carboxypeptidase family protein